MAKNKSAQPDKASKVSKDAQVKSISSVKQGGVTKPSQTSKSKSKEMAKQVAVKADKKSKKAKKEPTPVPESASDDDSSSESSASSEDESEVEAPAPTKATKSNGTKANGVSKVVAAIKDEDSGSSDSASSDDEPPAPKSAPAAAAKAVAGAKEDSASDDESEATSEGTSDNEVEPKVKGAIDAKALNGKLETVASKEVSSDDDSDSEAEGTSSGTSDESSSGDESVEEAAPAPKKRKAEAEATPVSKKAKTDSGADDAAQKNLFVGHLSYNVDEEWLTREFEEFGELTRVKVILDRDSGQSKGFGYVEFLNPEDGVKAQAAMHEKEIDGRAVNVDFSKPKTEAAPRQDRQKTYGDNTSPASETIFVANLPFEITEDAVAEEFQKHGAVLGVRLPTDRDTGNPKGFGYVQFGSVEESQDVFNKMTGAVIMGRPIRMDFSTPRPPREDGASGGRGGRGGGRGGRGGFDRGGRGGGRGRGGFDRGGGRGGRGGSTNRGGFGDFKGQKKTF